MEASGTSGQMALRDSAVFCMETMAVLMQDGEEKAGADVVIARVVPAPHYLPFFPMGSNVGRRCPSVPARFVRQSIPSSETAPHGPHPEPNTL